MNRFLRQKAVVLSLLALGFCGLAPMSAQAAEQKASVRAFDEDGNWTPDAWWEDDGDDGYGDDEDEVYPEPTLNTTDLYLIAQGDSFELTVSDAASASYAVAAGGDSVIRLKEPSNASVTIEPLAAGTAEVTVTATAGSGKTYTLACQVTVSQPRLASSSVKIVMNKSTGANVEIRGLLLDRAYYSADDDPTYTMDEALAYDNRCWVRVAKPDVASAYIYDGSLHIEANQAGSTKVRVSVYGYDMLLQVKVSQYKLNRYTVNTYKGSKTKYTLRVIGAGKEKVTWTSSNPKVVKISKKGVAVTKGIGTSKITAEIDGIKFTGIYAVSSKKAYQAVKKAREIAQKKNIHYSQTNRMSQNYYDCSSLVWRIYKQLGIRFGNQSSWAPTAALEGKWCVDTKRVVARKGVEISSRKLLPGDTLYYAYSGDNGRYLSISHTAIFAGYSYDEYFGFYGTVIEASSSMDDVVERQYFTDGVVLIGRPTR